MTDKATTDEKMPEQIWICGSRLQWVSKDDIGDFAPPPDKYKYTHDPDGTLKEKAAAYDRIKPMLDELIEVRKKATDGEWHDAHDMGISIHTIYDADGQTYNMKLFDVRGWGHLTGLGYARGLSEEEAIKIQRANISFVTTAARIAQEVGDDGK